MYSKKLILKIVKTCKIRAIWKAVWMAIAFSDSSFETVCLFLFVDCPSWKYLTAACAAQVAKRVVLSSFQHGYTFWRARCPFRNGGLATILVHLYLNFLNHVRYVYYIRMLCWSIFHLKSMVDLASELFWRLALASNWFGLQCPLHLGQIGRVRYITILPE